MSFLRVTPSDEDRAEAQMWAMRFETSLTDKDDEILAGIIAAVRAAERLAAVEIMAQMNCENCMDHGFPERQTYELSDPHWVHRDGVYCEAENLWEAHHELSGEKK